MCYSEIQRLSEHGQPLFDSFLPGWNYSSIAASSVSGSSGGSELYNHE